MDRRGFTIGLTALTLAGGPVLASDAVRMRTLYNKDLSFSDFARSHAGGRIAVSGYMAPPLKADASFFVLTNRPMTVCPFCSDEAEWPDDILAVYTKRKMELMPFNRKILVRGVLSLGGRTDPETGFVSRVRLEDATYQRD